jgi:hypothetical protein
MALQLRVAGVNREELPLDAQLAEYERRGEGRLTEMMFMSTSRRV